LPITEMFALVTVMTDPPVPVAVEHALGDVADR
jgi:hypothetical protein